MHSTATILLGMAVLAMCPAAGAVDIPMDPRLAEARLDSKTCYGTITANGRLVGYELQDLLVGRQGRLAALTKTSQADIGDGKTRTYAADGLAVTIVPRRTKMRDGATQDIYTIEERASARFVENGVARRIDVLVVLDCSP
ncbi:hypothetical protein GJV26_18420 [Massilia dura]|uniref:Uncharacterized protein n=1 Tax=Pseudoduganella dura TaxID=321982 RepID=A0A6I3XDE2_9BURK|nr:hypothetical protein [Pseudoduganella dura]MUI14417.1 hypothetical protein [Pseudoduganella dura]GGY05738.1 hypothetical protein GCM10007386_40610 [Pseudoduganella dura]